MGGVIQEVRLGLRAFVRQPTFALVATGTLALGIAAYATLFSVVDGVLLRPVDLPEPERLVVVRMQVDGELRDLTGPNALDLLLESGGVFSSSTAFWSTGLPVENPDGTRELRPGVGATPGVFETLAAPLQLGRPWGPEAMGAGTSGSVVITDRLWRSRFGADPSLVGSTLSANGVSVLVTGVLAPGVEFPLLEDADLIFPPFSDPGRASRAGLGAFTVLARLQPGVSLERARSEVRGIWEGIRTRHPGELLDHGVVVESLQDYAVRDVRPALLALLGATTLLLVLACANVANLMLARGLDRGTEMSIRSSLGAGRGRLVRQLLVEGGVLAVCAGVAGVLLAEGSLAVLRSVAPAEMTGIAEATLTARAVGVALAVAAGCAVLVGLVPALRVSGTDLSSALRSGTRSTGGRKVRRLQGSLVVAQVAAALVLAVGAGLLVRSFSALADVDPGYRTEGILTAGMSLPRERYPDRASRAAFFEQVEREVAELPGVRRVGTTYRAPFSEGELSVPVRLADAEEMTMDEAPRVEVGIVSAGYLEALDIPVLAGRGFGDEDRRESPRVALLSASLAERLYGDEDPTGRRLAPVLGSWETSTDWVEVVGVVGDVRLQSLDTEAAGTLYLAAPQMAQTWATLMVRTTGDPAELTAAVRDVLTRLEPKLILPSMETMASLRSESLARPRFNSLLLSTFSALAMVLAAVGLYGMLSYSVATRRLELGVRMAFGADRTSVLRLVLMDGLKLTVMGVLIGLAGALAVGPVLSGLLFGITPNDPATFGGSVLGVLALALAGSLLPALRAARDDSLGALKGK